MQSPELALELRAARPVASAELRQQVRALAAERTPPRRGFVLPPLRRAALVAISVLLAVAIGGALVEGIANSGSAPGPDLASTLHSSGAQGSATDNFNGPPISGKPNLQNLQARRQFSQAIPTLPGRLQQYGAFLRVQVENVAALSDATKRALRFAQLLGGYVAYVRYTTPVGGGGAAALIVRVPVDRVQDAIQEYSSLGTILAQNVSLLDVTKQVEEQAKEIARLEAEIARLEAGTITAAVRARIEADGARLAYLTKHKAATVARAELARIALELTTKPKHAVATSRFQRTMSAAGGVLLREAELMLYALIVAGPLLLLGAAAIGGGRFTQRRRVSRLLERS
jgi:hypothetical protein